MGRRSHSPPRGDRNSVGQGWEPALIVRAILALIISALRRIGNIFQKSDTSHPDQAPPTCPPRADARYDPVVYDTERRVMLSVDAASAALNGPPGQLNGPPGESPLD